MTPPHSMGSRALDALWLDATRKNELTLHYIRMGVWTLVSLALFGAAWATGNPPRSALFYGVYLVFLLVLGEVAIARTYRPWSPFVFTLLDISVLLANCAAVAAEPSMAGPMVTEVFNGSALGLLLILGLNALRFDGRVSVVTGALATLAYLSVRFAYEGFDPYRLVDGVVMAGITFGVALSNRRNRTLLAQIYGDLRSLHAQRVQTMARLVAGVSHELNTPAGVLHASLDTLDRTLERSPPELHRQASWERTTLAIKETRAAARAALTRIERILQALNAFSPPDAADLAWTDLHVGLDASLELVRGQLGAGLHVERHFDPELPPILCQPLQVNQIWFNLLENAVAAMDGQGTLRVSTEKKDDSVEVRIRDEGRGMRAEELESVFEPGFVRGGPRVKMRLGLAMSRSIAQDHGGSLLLESRLGEGTCAVVRLPLSPH